MARRNGGNLQEAGGTPSVISVMGDLGRTFYNEGREGTF